MRTRGKKKLLPFQQKLSPAERKLRQFTTDMNSKRSCGDCTACCDAIAVEEINKPEFTPCKHLCGTGCAIYRSRPAQCRSYACSWKALWTPNDESWRPDHLGVIFDIHERGMGVRIAIRCWQLRSETQILDDPKVRRMAYGLAAQSKYPIVARYGHTENVSIHLISGLEKLHGDLYRIDPTIPTYLLTPDVISDPQDFDKKRELLSDCEIKEIVNQFGLKAFEQHMGLRQS